jgi:hypothetical protein
MPASPDATPGNLTSSREVRVSDIIFDWIGTPKIVCLMALSGYSSLRLGHSGSGIFRHGGSTAEDDLIPGEHLWRSPTHLTCGRIA